LNATTVTWRAWLARRLPGRRGPHHGALLLAQRNVFVLPTRPGLLYATVLLAMLIASINYALSLGFMLTFLLGAVAVVAMLHTFRNLSALELTAGRLEPVFAGGHAELHVALGEKRSTERYAVELHPQEGSRELVDIAADAQLTTTLRWPARTRGLHPLPRIRLSTRFPLGLWQAWSWWRPAGSVLVYPAPERPTPPLPSARDAAGEGATGGAGDEDLAALRPYAPGDPPRRIAWKAVARSGSDTLLVKQFEGSAGGELLLDWQALPAGLDAEARLSRLAAWVIEADTQGLRWALQLPGESLPVDAGMAHRERCLQALALARV
jgi:uncharacterized protein (DUF58 family)